MKNYLFILLIALVACDKKDGPSGINDTVFRLEYLNSKSEDLLDSDTPNYYKWGNVRLYPDINNLEEPFYNGMLEHEYGYDIFKDMNMEYHQISITEVSDNGGKPFIIKLSNTDTDTIECQVINKITRKIWYNGELKWEYDSQTPKIIRIIKD